MLEAKKGNTYQEGIEILVEDNLIQNVVVAGIRD